MFSNINILTKIFRLQMIIVLLMFLSVHLNAQLYTTCKSFDEVINSMDAKYPKAIRVSPTGNSENPMYHGYFFYNCLQFDPTGRYMLGMRIHIEGRAVEPADRGNIGIIDLQDNFKWTEIGQTTAWNWQQGSRLQWRPGSSEEILWNDRSHDDKKFVCRVYNIRTGETRTLPRPIYAISPDGITALTHDFERMEHRGTMYVGIEDKYRNQWAPNETGIWKMNLNTGRSELIMSLDRIADIVYPNGRPPSPKGHLYIFREGWNPSGTRFITFVKDIENGFQGAYSMTPDGKDVRYLYYRPSHHFWRDDETILDWGTHTPSGGKEPIKGYFIFKDDGSGEAKEMLWPASSDGHCTYHPGREWILTDTYNIEGYQHLYMYHLPTKLFVPLGKFRFTLHGKHQKSRAGLFRVDLHPRFNPDGTFISFDSTHEGLGRQIYIIEIGYIVDNPPH